MWQFFQKFIGNLKLSKTFTDLLPGVLSTFAILFFIGAFSEMIIMPFESIDKLKSEKKCCLQKIEKAIASKDLEDLQKLKQQFTEKTITLEKAYTLEKNINVISDIFLELILLGVIFGVIGSQLTRGIIVERLYESVFRYKVKAGGKIKPEIKKILDTKLSPGYFMGIEKLDHKQYEKVVTGYYNYMESCVNNIIPVFLMGISLSCYFHYQFGVKGSLLFVPIITSAVICPGLLYSGYLSYKRFKIRTSELILGKYESTEFKEPEFRGSDDSQ